MQSSNENKTGGVANQSQHYVPQSFLRGFTDNEEGWFHELDLRSQRIQRKHVRNVCCIDNFYDIRNDQILQNYGITDARYLEKSFQYENRLRRVLGQIRKREKYLLLRDFQVIVEAYVGMKHRTKYYRKKISDRNLITDSFNKVAAEVKEHFKHILPYFPAYNFDESVQKFKEQLLLDKNHATDTHLHGMVESSMGFESPVRDAINKILSMNISIFETQSDEYFIISDNPGYSLNGSQMWNTNYGSFDTIHFPVNSKQIIVLRNFDGRNYVRPLIRLNYYTLPVQDIREINRMTSLVADEKLFCVDRTYLQNYRTA